MKITVRALKKLVKEAFGETQETIGQVLKHVSVDELEREYPDAADALFEFSADWRELAEEGTYTFEMRDFHGGEDGGELVLVDRDQYDMAFVFNGETWEELDEETILR